MDPWVNHRAIVDFVRRVETTKGYQPDVNLVFRHIAEELGELAAALWRHDQARLRSDLPDGTGVGRECLDLIFLACYLADLCGADLGAQLPDRMREVATQYQVAP